MVRLFRLTGLAVTAAMLALTLSTGADAQRRPAPRHPQHPRVSVVVRGRVFIGGYFYDPAHGPYPWWSRAGYPHWYFPVFDRRAEVHLRMEPKEAEKAAVYVDGFYAGIVDDFNNVFQSLPLPPGGHSIVIYLEGFRTVRHNLYLRPGSTLTVHETMQRLPAGVVSELPDVVPPVPPPPPGTYRPPVTPPRPTPPATATQPPSAAGFGTLDVYVQPAGADLSINGQRWVSSDEGHFLVQVPVGTHRIEVHKSGYRPFTTALEVGDGETRPLNVSLIAGGP